MLDLSEGTPFFKGMSSAKDRPPEHYYGDTVRKLFLLCGVVMLVGYAFFSNLIAVPTYVAIGAAVVLALVAGLQNPRHTSLIVVNMVISVVACFTFAYTGVKHYLNATTFDPWFFWINQALALLFFIATYYSSKTVRASVFKGKV